MSTFHWPLALDMDVSHLDDKMEIGTSPYPQIDDIDFDFDPDPDPDRHQSVDRSMADEAEIGGDSIDPMQADEGETYNDDDMFDESTAEQTYGHDNNDPEDLNMEPDNGETTNPDDEVLYDEDLVQDETIDQQDDQPVEESFIQTQEKEFQIEFTEDLGLEADTDAHGRNNTNQINTTSQPDTQSGDTASEKQQAHPNVPNEASASNPVDVVDFATEETHQDKESYGQDHLETPSIPSDEVNSARTDGKESKIETLAQKQQVQDPSDPSTDREHPRLEEVVPEFDEPGEPGDEQHNVEEPVGTLHPVTVLYLGQEMSLFPPMVEDSSATFFLSDSGLAYESVERLLASCREILGETLEHDDELVLDVPALGLHICEDSKYASQLTLSQVIEVYLNLTHNDSVESAEPLYCNLSSRVCLTSQYNYLAASAAEGKTYSEIIADYADTPENETNKFEEGIGGDHRNDFPESSSRLLAHSEVSVIGIDHQTDKTDTLENSSRQIQETLDEIDDGVGDSAAITTTEHLAADGHLDQQNERNEPEENTTDTTPETAILSQTAVQPGSVQSQYDLIASAQHDPAASDDGDGELYEENDNVDTLENINEATAPEESEGVSSHTVEAEILSQSDPHSQKELVSEDGIAQNHTRSDEQIQPQSDSIGQSNELPVDNQQHEDLIEETTKTATVVDANIEYDSDGYDAEEQLTFDEVDVDDADANDQNDEAVAVPPNAEAVAPVTPSKPNGYKRKALEEDEELDFDLATPEPKRNRSA